MGWMVRNGSANDVLRGTTAFGASKAGRISAPGRFYGCQQRHMGAPEQDSD